MKSALSANGVRTSKKQQYWMRTLRLNLQSISNSKISQRYTVICNMYTYNKDQYKIPTMQTCDIISRHHLQGPKFYKNSFLGTLAAAKGMGRLAPSGGRNSTESMVVQRNLGCFMASARHRCIHGSDMH